ncbi:MAG: lipoprotein insertase outer membrane protein LolB [Gammaproteobacteria bacterium]
MKQALAAALVLSAALLAGCTTFVHPQGAANEAAWHERLGQLEQLRAWHLAGRIGVVTPHRGGSASLDWEERGRWMKLSFSGPFGIGAVKLAGTPERFVITNSKGREWVTNAPASALEQSLGWPVPVASLRYWIVGRPSPDAPYRLSLGARGLVKSLTQKGWTVRYSAYSPVGGLLLPTRLAASRPGGHVKVIVSKWHLVAARSTGSP